MAPFNEMIPIFDLCLIFTSHGLSKNILIELITQREESLRRFSQQNDWINVKIISPRNGYIIMAILIESNSVEFLKD